MSEAYIIDAVRTPRGIGKVGKGALAGLHPQHLAATVLRALQRRNDLNTAEVDDIIWGTSAQKGKQGGDMGRMAALDAGFDVRASGVTLDRFCGSGLTATSMAAAQIRSGMEDLVIAGGTEMMSLITSMGQEEAAAGFLADLNETRLREVGDPVAPAIKACSAKVNGIDHHAFLQSVVDRRVDVRVVHVCRIIIRIYAVRQHQHCAPVR